MVSLFCERCGSQQYERLRTHSYCIECNFSPSWESSTEETVIPYWVLGTISLSSEEKKDLYEINLGLYRSGYEKTLSFVEEHSVPQNIVKRVSRKKSCVNANLKNTPFRKMKTKVSRFQALAS